MALKIWPGRVQGLGYMALYGWYGPFVLKNISKGRSSSRYTQLTRSTEFMELGFPGVGLEVGSEGWVIG